MQSDMMDLSGSQGVFRDWNSDRSEICAPESVEIT